MLFNFFSPLPYPFFLGENSPFSLRGAAGTIPAVSIVQQRQRLGRDGSPRLRGPPGELTPGAPGTWARELPALDAAAARGCSGSSLRSQAGGAAASLPDRFLSQDLLSSAWLNMSKSPEVGWRSACQANENIGAPEGNRRLC